jgi:D-alanyl-D-alanine carboxypeptidase
VQADDVETLVTSEMQQHHVVGVSCLVLKDGQPPDSIYAGTANLEWHTPVTADTEFEIGSVTKQFTAACILILADEGKLSVNDPISQYLTNTPAAWSQIKIRNLLSHTSGVVNYDGLDGFELRQHLTQAEFVAKLARYPLDFPPGEAWKYSNSGFSLLGFIVANVSGKPYWQFLHEHILDPLQMTNTYDRNPQFLIPHRANGYVYRKSTQTYENRDYDLTDLNAAGTIVSTVTDLAKWDAAIHGDGVLKPATKKLWWSPVIMNNGQPLTRVGRRAGSYGFGWFLDPEKTHKSIWHTGVTSGFSAANEWYPDDHLTIIILSNTDEGGFAGDLADKIAAHYFGEAEKK